MSQFSFKIPSCFLLLLFFFVFLLPYFVSLLCSFSPLFFTTLFLLALFLPNLDDDDSRSSGSMLGFLLSVVESLVPKNSSKNDENGEGIRRFDEEFLAYLDVFRETELEDVLEGNCSESGISGEEGGRESKAHVGPTENKPKGNFDQTPFMKNADDGNVEAAGPIAEQNEFCERKCNEVLEGNDGRESRNHVGPLEKVPSCDFDDNPFEKEKGNLVAARKIEDFSESHCSEDEEGTNHAIEDPTVSAEGKPAGEEDDDEVDKAGKNTKLKGMFCQKGDKEVKPVDTDPNKAEEEKESKDKTMSQMLRSGSKVLCNDGKIDAKNSEEEEEEEYFGTPQTSWDYSRRIRSYGLMRKEKQCRKTLAFKFDDDDDDDDDYHDFGISSKSEAMDLLWETYEDLEHDKVKETTESEAHEEEDKEEDEEEEEKENSVESKYCCLQAFKLSAGKVNLGIKKPSLMKISKAIKSIGLLHHHISKRSRKKIH